MSDKINMNVLANVYGSVEELKKDLQENPEALINKQGLISSVLSKVRFTLTTETKYFENPKDEEVINLKKLIRSDFKDLVDKYNLGKNTGGKEAYEFLYK